MLLKTFLAMNGIKKQPGDSPIPLHAKQPQAAKETNKRQTAKHLSEPIEDVTC